MSVVNLIARLRRLDVALRLDSGRVLCDAPAHALTPELRAELVERKAEILAFLVRASGAGPSASPRIPARARRPGEDLPLSSMQERLWFLEELAPGSPTYNLVLAARLDGPLDRASLHAAIQCIVARHEILRTSFHAHDGRPSQRAHAHVDVELEVRPAAGASDTALTALATAEARVPLDLSRAPLLRTVLFERGPADHVFLVVVHHLVCDVWSLDLFMRELRASYTALVAGRSPALPELSLAYADYVFWQREQLELPDSASRLAHWVGRLAHLAHIELPLDRPRSARQGSDGAVASFQIDRPTSERLRQLCREQQLTPFVVLLTALQVALFRYSGQTDVAVGTSVANRHARELEPLIGFFVNTLVIRVDLSGDPSVRQLLRRTAAETLAAHEHHAVPFERIVEALQPDRDARRSPLFQVMFAFQNAMRPLLEGQVGELRMQPFSVNNGTANFDLTCYARDSGDDFVGWFNYSTELFTAPTIERFTSSFKALLRAMLNDIDQRLSQLDMLAAEERTRILGALSAGRPDPLPEATVAELFAAQAARTPDAVAVSAGSTSLTYQALRERANRLARELRCRGMGPERSVGVIATRTIDAVVAILAFSSCGAAWVPLDEDAAPERVSCMIADTGLNLVIATSTRTPPWLPKHVELLRPERERLGRHSVADLDVRATARNAAYVIYTSGSTGRPKGVVIEQRSMLAMFTAMRRVVDHGAARLRVTVNAPLTFDASVQQLVGLLVGHTLCLVPAEIRTDGPAFVEHLADHAVELLDCTPSNLRLLVAAGMLEAELPLSRVIVAGEALDAPLWAELAHAKHLQCYNAYGPTECSVDSTACSITPHSLAPSIGRPIPNYRCYVVDAAGQLLPVGVAGELWVAGPGIARGYLARPDLTAERFSPDPFATHPGERVYRTGDIVRWRADGELEFLGRGDRQVKLRGYRIELGEIENALGRHDAVARAFVQVVDERLVAYLTLAPGAPTPSTESLRELLGRWVPAYMIPAAYHILSALPLNANGKVDRSAIAAAIIADAPERASDAPKTAIQQIVAGIWSEVLKLDSVGLHDNFFDLGGQSLVASQVIARTRRAFDVALPLRGLFEAPTVVGLSVEIERLLRSAAQAPETPLTRRPHAEPAPASAAQQRLWFVQAFAPEQPTHNFFVGFELEGPLDVEALRVSFERIIHRHELLRTSFDAPSGVPMQVVSAPARFVMPCIDLRAVASDDALVQRIIRAHARAVFDLGRGSLLRVALVLRRHERAVLLLTLHHIVTDFWSMQLLYGELSAGYRSALLGEALDIPPLPVQYSDYALWEQERLLDPGSAGQLEYWANKLESAPLLELPLDRPRRDAPSHRGARHGFQIPASNAAALRALGKRHDATPFMTLLAAFVTLLHRYTDATDIVIGTPSIDRMLETERLIGPFLNTLVLRIDVSGEPSFAALLARIRAVALDAYAHRATPFEQITRRLRAGTPAPHAPLFRVMFAYQSARGPGLTLEGTRLRSLEADTGAAEHDLFLGISDGDSGLNCTLIYDRDLFDVASVQRLARRYVDCLSHLLAEPARPIAELPFFSEAELSQLLALSRGPARDRSDQLVHQQFAHNATRSPGSIALLYDDRALSYAELHAEAEAIRGQLEARRLAGEERVGLVLERSPELVAALLGTLASGACCVLIDPAWPISRVAHVLHEAQVHTLLTSSALLRAELVHALPARDRVLVIEPSSAGRAGSPTAAPELDAERAALVTYTSTPSGGLAGHVLSHAALAYGSAARADAFRIGAGDRMSLSSQLTLGTCIQEIFPCLLRGATLVIRRECAVESVERLMRGCERDRITVLCLTAGVWNDWLATLVTRRLPKAVRLIALDTATVLSEQLEAWRGLAGTGVALLGSYGPSELAHSAALADLASAPAMAGVLLGAPLPAAKVYVLTRGLDLAPPGTSGEIYVGGPGLARGYLDQPDLTAEYFVPDPFAAMPGARLYRTGERARYLAAGGIEYLARADGRSNIGSVLVSPAEAENALKRRPDVAAAAVIERRRGNETVLVAFVERAADSSTPADAWLHDLATELPPAHIPREIVTLARLPRTSTGNVDRAVLATLGAVEGRAEQKPHASELADSVEQNLVELWREQLHITPELDHDFFALGGHSLSAMRLLVAIRRSLGVDVSVRTLFQSSTVRKLAQHVRAALWSRGSTQLAGVRESGEL